VGGGAKSIVFSGQFERSWWTRDFAAQQEAVVAKRKLALNPKHPERICWGCDKYCSGDDLRCGNGTVRTQHPVELFGEDWLEWELGNNADIQRDLTQKDHREIRG
jgi:hypothetical protein